MLTDLVLACKEIQRLSTLGMFLVSSPSDGLEFMVESPGFGIMLVSFSTTLL